jgi:hypothetical protein
MMAILRYMKWLMWFIVIKDPMLMADVIDEIYQSSCETV